MSQAKRFSVFMDIRIRQFYRICQLGISAPFYGRIQTTPRKFYKVSNSLRNTAKRLLCFMRCSRYGIRVDPIQWFYVLTGKDEGGAEHPSLVLLLCR